jgi:hypothetical protein
VTTDVFPPGADGHPEVEEISALTEGLLAPQPAQRLRTHLADCALCADVHASLEEIRGVLGTLPGPAPMPAELAGRIDAALAAEALLDAATADPTGRAVSRETAVPSHRRSSASTDVSRETGGSERPPGRPKAATGPGRPRARRSRRRTALVTTACTVVALGLAGVLAQQSLTDDGSDPAKTPRTSAQDARLEHHVQRLLAAARTSPSTDEPGPSAPAQGGGQAPSAPMPLAGGGPTSVPTCIREGIHRTQTPLAVDERTAYHGKPAYLVVLPHPGDPQRVDAYLVDATCTTGADSGPGQVLLTRTYPRS